jgi:hypothetical protein
MQQTECYEVSVHGEAMSRVFRSNWIGKPDPEDVVAVIAEELVQLAEDQEMADEEDDEVIAQRIKDLEVASQIIKVIRTLETGEGCGYYAGIRLGSVQVRTFTAWTPASAGA